MCSMESTPSSWTKWSPFRWRNFQMHFHEWKKNVFWFEFHLSSFLMVDNKSTLLEVMSCRPTGVRPSPSHGPMLPQFTDTQLRHQEDMTLQWRHSDHDGVSNHQPNGCLLNRLFRRRSKKPSKLRVTGLCVGNSPGPVNSPHKGPVTRKMFPFDDVIMVIPASNDGGCISEQAYITINRTKWYCSRICIELVIAIKTFCLRYASEVSGYQELYVSKGRPSYLLQWCDFTSSGDGSTIRTAPNTIKMIWHTIAFHLKLTIGTCT